MSLIILHAMSLDFIYDSLLKPLFPDEFVKSIIEFHKCFFFPLLTLTVLSPFIFQLFFLHVIVYSILVYSKGLYLQFERSTKISNIVHSFRGITLILTCIAILAVDFHIFPRAFMKTESHGISLMDLGVGSFVFLSGLCSSVARGGPKGRGGLKRWFKFGVVFLLGVGRLVITRWIDYDVVEGEYGLDWNFFVTLGVVWVAGDLLHLLIPHSHSTFLYILTILSLSLLHSCLVVPFGESILTSHSPEQQHHNGVNWDRSLSTSFIERNVEGVVSSLGFLILFISSQLMGRCLVWTINHHQPNSSSTKEHHQSTTNLLNFFQHPIIGSNSTPTPLLLFSSFLAFLCGFIAYFLNFTPSRFPKIKER